MSNEELEQKVSSLQEEFGLTRAKARFVATNAMRGLTALGKAPFRRDSAVKKVQKQMDMSADSARELLVPLLTSIASGKGSD